MRVDEEDELGVGGGGGEITYGAVMVEALPEGCIANIISLTTPPDACRLLSVSRCFRSVAESDTVWSMFLPPEIPTILSHSGPDVHNCRSKSKEFYLALCDNPVLIDDGKMRASPAETKAEGAIDDRRRTAAAMRLCICVVARERGPAHEDDDVSSLGGATREETALDGGDRSSRERGGRR
ncbi:hypothetical protein ACLB2K_034133 [Fragaria x ananassa]